MEAIFVKSGNTIEFTPQSDVTSGGWVITGTLVGITKNFVAAGTLGTFETSGLFENVEKHNSSNALTDGQVVWLNPTNKKIYNASATGYIMVGYAVGAATSTATSCKILLHPNGTVGT